MAEERRDIVAKGIIIVGGSNETNLSKRKDGDDDDEEIRDDQGRGDFATDRGGGTAKENDVGGGRRIR